MNSAFLRGHSWFAASAGGLALMVASCGAVMPPRHGSISGLPSGSNVIYVVDSPRLLPVDLAHQTTSRPVTIPGGNDGVEVTPDHRRAYVLVGSRFTGSQPRRLLRKASLIPINLMTGARGRRIILPTGSSRFVIAPDGRTAYVLDHSIIVPVNLRTGAAGRRIVLPKLSVGAFDFFLGAAAAPVACVTGVAITASAPRGRHAVIECADVATRTTRRPVPMPKGTGVLAAALAPDGRTFYVASGNTLAPIDLITGRAGRPVRLPMMLGIGAIAITADGRTAYVGNLKPEIPSSGIIVPIDLSTLTARRPIHVPSYPYSITDIVILRGGRTAAAAANSAVIPIDLTTRKPAKPIKMPAGVSAIILAG